MKVLLYSITKKEAGRKVQKIIEALWPKEACEYYRTIESLSLRIRQRSNDVGLAVLVAASFDDLSGLLAIRDLIADTRSILILPDRKSKTISCGHRLYPRFISYAGGNFMDVAAVLKKMLEEFRD